MTYDFKSSSTAVFCLNIDANRTIDKKQKKKHPCERCDECDDCEDAAKRRRRKRRHTIGYLPDEATHQRPRRMSENVQDRLGDIYRRNNSEYTETRSRNNPFKKLATNLRNALRFLPEFGAEATEATERRHTEDARPSTQTSNRGSFKSLTNKIKNSLRLSPNTGGRDQQQRHAKKGQSQSSEKEKNKQNSVDTSPKSKTPTPEFRNRHVDRRHSVGHHGENSRKRKSRRPSDEVEESLRKNRQNTATQTSNKKCRRPTFKTTTNDKHLLKNTNNFKEKKAIKSKQLKRFRRLLDKAERRLLEIERDQLMNNKPCLDQTCSNRTCPDKKKSKTDLKGLVFPKYETNEKTTPSNNLQNERLVDKKQLKGRRHSVRCHSHKNKRIQHERFSDDAIYRKSSEKMNERNVDKITETTNQIPIVKTIRSNKQNEHPSETTDHNIKHKKDELKQHQEIEKPKDHESKKETHLSDSFQKNSGKFIKNTPDGKSYIFPEIKSEGKKIFDTSSSSSRHLENRRHGTVNRLPEEDLQERVRKWSDDAKIYIRKRELPFYKKKLIPTPKLDKSFLHRYQTAQKEKQARDAQHPIKIQPDLKLREEYEKFRRPKNKEKSNVDTKDACKYRCFNAGKMKNECKNDCTSKHNSCPVICDKSPGLEKISHEIIKKEFENITKDRLSKDQKYTDKVLDKPKENELIGKLPNGTEKILEEYKRTLDQKQKTPQKISKMPDEEVQKKVSVDKQGVIKERRPQAIKSEKIESSHVEDVAKHNKRPDSIDLRLKKETFITDNKTPELEDIFFEKEKIKKMLDKESSASFHPEEKIHKQSTGLSDAEVEVLKNFIKVCQNSKFPSGVTDVFKKVILEWKGIALNKDASTYTDPDLMQVQEMKMTKEVNYGVVPYGQRNVAQQWKSCRAKKIVIRDNATTMERCVLFFAEFLGTWILVLLGCMGCVASITGGPIPHEQISLTFGFAIVVAIQCFGHISGGHVNPAVTAAAAVLGHLPLVQVPIYFLAQFAGGIAGYGTLMILTPGKHLAGGMKNTSDGLINVPGVCSPGINPQISVYQGLAMEFLLTFILVFLVCAIWDWKNFDKHDSVTIRIGLAVAALAMAGGPYSGANMNPARSFGPALLNGDWENHWVYWIGPMAGGTIAGLLYRLVFTKPQPVKDGVESIPLNDKA